MPISHTLIKVATANHSKTVAFYVEALKPLGYEKVLGLGSGKVGLGVNSYEWWVAATEDDATSKVHVAFAAPDRASVDAFYAAALATGGKDNGPPGLRLNYSANYYAAFVIDPVGNNIEAACTAPVDQDKK